MWIVFAVGAAFVQNLRFMVQKHLAGTDLSAAGSTFSRFIYSAPVVVLLACVLMFMTEQNPDFSSRFFGFSVLGGVSQILATICVVILFSMRNFTVGITFKKTETLLAAFVGALVLGDTLAPVAWGIISIGFLGVILMSKHPIELKGGIFNRSLGLGLASGLLFAISGVSYRAASLSLDVDSFALRAVLTLAFVTSFQALVMAIYLRWFEKNQVTRVLKAWRITGLVGLFGMIGSLGWFLAFTLQNVALVKMVGQIELVFAAMASYFFFKERMTLKEILGVVLITLSVLGIAGLVLLTK